MARNKIVHLGDIELNPYSRSKYIVNKQQYINKKYNKLYLKDIVCDKKGRVYGLCDCMCGEQNILTGINNLLTYRTISCSGCARAAGSGFNSKYNSDEYIGKVFGHLKIIGYYFGTNENNTEKAVYFKTVCTLCGTEKDFKASHLINGTTTSCGCVLHNRNNKYSDKDWIGMNIEGTEVLDILEKTSEGQIWLCKCKYCGKKFKAIARKITSRHTNSCGCLGESIGVTEISKYLDINNITYIREWSHPKLLSQYGYELRYDFAIVKNNKIIALIEYDGSQHYNPKDGFGDFETREDRYYDIVDSDNRKNEFAKINNIPLLRISYNRKSEQIINELSSFIHKLNII